MKKLLFLVLLAFGMNAKAQIALEHTYPKGDGNSGRLRVVHLTAAGYKYSEFLQSGNTGVINLYNLNHSFYKSINVPPQNGTFVRVYYISDELFNTNPLDIEYLVRDYNSTTVKNYIHVYDEIGNTLFSKDSVILANSGETWNFWEPVFYTPSGVKMILYRDFGFSSAGDSSAFVYSLPGILPCNDCANGIISGLTDPNGGGELGIGIENSYPNPAINSTRIDYTFPNGVNQGEIVIYDLQGKELRCYKVDKTFDHLLISTYDIPAGTYFYQLQTSAQVSEGKKMVVIK